MKEYILGEEENNEETQEIEVKAIQPIKKNFLNYKNFIIIFLILDIISFLLFIISFFISSKVMLWLFFFLMLLFSILLSILIYFKLKKDKLEEEEKKRKEEEIRIEKEERKRKEEEIRIKEEEERKRKEEEEIRIKEEERKRKEEEKFNEMKKKMLENQKKAREEKINDNKTEKEVNDKINDLLEDMCIYGNIINKEIKEEKEKNPEKFIETSQALQKENEDQGLFALGLISQNLENIGIETAIEKDENEEEKDAASTCLQFITNGLCEKKKYDLHFEFGEKRNEELLNNKEEFEKFKKNLKLKLSKDYNIPEDKIIVTFPQKGSYHVQVIFQSEEFNDLDTNEFLNKFKNDNEFKELSNLKEIHKELVMKGCKLSKNQLDPRGNRNDGWGVGENRGGKPYDPPIGWNGIGLKVWDKYGDNTWIGMDNVPGEWCVAYHGVASGQSSDNVKHITGLIYKSEFKAGGGQAHEHCPDQYHPGKKVGPGVYCTPTIKTAEGYAGISKVNGMSYKTVLMVRVNPNSIRHCDICDDSRAPYNYWVVNGTTDEIRPYRILYKKC